MVNETAETVETPTPVEKLKEHLVVEIFGPVIQGEGSQAGQQTMFVRFGGCDYRCQKCDSLHAVIPEAVLANSRRMTYKDIARELEEAYHRTGVKWVTFSGGNPCMQDLTQLVDQLIYNGWFINVETQGTLWRDWLYNVTMVTVSPKSPGMGEKFEEAKYRKFIGKLNGMRPLCVKVVAFSAQDLEFARHVYEVTEDVKLQWLYEAPGAIAYYLSQGNSYPPVLTEDNKLVDNPEYTGSIVSDLLTDFKFLCEEILPDPRLKPFRFLPQLHVLVYGNETGR